MFAMFSRMPNTTRDILKKFEQVTATISKYNNPLFVCLAMTCSVSACQALAQQVAEGMLQANQIIQQHVQRHLSYTCTPNEFEALMVNVLLLLKMSFLEPIVVGLFE
jgi:hypothetical protein